jgi:hypothetical protein
LHWGVEARKDVVFPDSLNFLIETDALRPIPGTPVNAPVIPAASSAILRLFLGALPR